MNVDDTLAMTADRRRPTLDVLSLSFSLAPTHTIMTYDVDTLELTATSTRQPNNDNDTDDRRALTNESGDAHGDDARCSLSLLTTLQHT